MSITTAVIQQRLAEALPGAAETVLSELAGELHAAWSQPHRAYHNLKHLSECLAWLDAAREQAQDPAAIVLALLFHDAVYRPQAHDNEALSALWAVRALTAVNAAQPLVEAVRQMILATQTHTTANDADTALLLDIDLAILGAAPARFAEYEAAIRSEYAFVPEPQYRAARAKVMRGFAARERLYLTEFFHARLDTQARMNLAQCLAALP